MGVVLRGSGRIGDLRVLRERVVLGFISIETGLIIDGWGCGSVAWRPRLSSLMLLEGRIGVVAPNSIGWSVVLARRKIGVGTAIHAILEMALVIRDVAIVGGRHGRCRGTRQAICGKIT